jgi:RNA polymerase sigma factor (sigma-70 family)
MTAIAMWNDGERRSLVRLCASLSGNRDVAEDLAQETLLEAWRHRHKLQHPEGADRWLAAVARNVCKRWATRNARAELLVANVPEVADVELERDDLAELLDGALELLPSAQRDVLVERYVHERSTPEIARALGVSDDAVSMRLARGKVTLRRLLDDAEWRETGIYCVICGERRLQTRRESGGEAIAFRCPSCDDGGLSARFPLDNPLFASLVGGLERPTAMFGRIGDWATGYWRGGDGAVVGCTRCGTAVRVRQAVRTAGPRSIRGLYVSCDRCGEQLWSSLVGVALADRGVRWLRRRAPRTPAVEREERSTVVVSFGDRDVAFDSVTHRLLTA